MRSWELQHISAGGSERAISSQDEILLLALPEVVLFPGATMPLADLSFLGTKQKRLARSGGMRVGVVTSLQNADESERIADIGTEAVIVSILKLPDGREGALLRGERVFAVNHIFHARRNLMAKVSYLQEKLPPQTLRSRALLRAIKSDLVRASFDEHAIPEDTIATIRQSQDPALVCHLIIPHLSLDTEQRLDLLAMTSVYQRMKKVHAAILEEIDLFRLSERIQRNVEGDIQEMQRRHFLREQIRVMKAELGEMEGVGSEFDRLEEKIHKLDCPEKVMNALQEELERMSQVPPGTPEYFVSHNYIQFVLDLPWKECLPPKPLQWRQALQTMNRSHFGQDQVKERILEYLAVIKHSKRVPGQILLLDGPPGVGKTSFVRAVAELLGRPFVRISLGGVKDESEIRGHRRTYVASMPGKIMQALRQAERRDPVVLLDEIDKMGNEQGQNVESALLEVLDPEQNKDFVDHFLGVGFDLSQVLFVATSNDASRLSLPLRDRMEQIDVQGYSLREKLTIAQKYIIPDLRRQLSLPARQFRINESALSMVIQRYTKETGVRQLRRTLETLARKQLRKIVERPQVKNWASLNGDAVTALLGPAPYLEIYPQLSVPGYVCGLAYTELGGELMPLEVNVVARQVMPQPLQVTGSLGKVLKESVSAAMSLIFAQLSADSQWRNYLTSVSVHVHFPDAATPKDGPSAGVAIYLGILSALCQRPIPFDCVFSGEISIGGRIHAVGGIRDKLLAAARAGKQRCLLPLANRQEALRVPKVDLGKLELLFVSTTADLLAALPGWEHPSVPVGALGLLENEARQDAIHSTLVPGHV